MTEKQKAEYKAKLKEILGIVDADYREIKLHALIVECYDAGFAKGKEAG